MEEVRPYGIGQAIIFLPCGFYLSFFFFLAYSQQSEIGCLPYFHTWCGLSANLECMSKMCCTRLTANTGRNNYAKNRDLRTIAHCPAISAQLSHVSTIGKKLVKQQYLLQMSVQYGELRSTTGWDRFGSLGHPITFQRVSHRGFVTTATSLNGRQPNFVRCLAVSWAGTLYIHFRGLLPLTEFYQLQNLLRVQVGTALQGMKLQNFGRGRHLYSAGRSSRWASAHILVMAVLSSRCGHYIFVLWFLLSIFFVLPRDPSMLARSWES